MLIFIENTPRRYAWGSRDALPELLGQQPDGEPQAELWLGDHPGAPASVAKASAKPQTLIELIESDPERYGVDGAQLPFLMKVLAIGAPLSLQVHPDKQQAEAGFAREEAAGIARDARERNYGDPNHKPEVLLALTEVTALAGFRPVADAHDDVAALAAAAAPGPGREALLKAASLCRPDDVVAAPGDRPFGGPDARERECRLRVFAWALGVGRGEAQDAVRAIAALVGAGGADEGSAGDLAAQPRATVDAREALEEALSAPRLTALRELCAEHPGDPGVLLSLLLHLVVLQPGEAVYLGARQLHAYLSGVGVEVMAASDNVLRAGLTEKHVDADELMQVVDWSTLESPRLRPEHPAPGLRVFSPDVPDFCLQSVRLSEAGDDLGDGDDASGRDRDGRITVIEELGSTGVIDLSGMQAQGERAEQVRVPVPYPTVMLVTEGRVRVERLGGEFSEVANVRRGQSLYISAGEAIEVSGRGDVFFATVGQNWERVSNPQ